MREVHRERADGGPERPPVRKLSLGCRALRSMDMPTKVLTAQSASAPAPHMPSR